MKITKIEEKFNTKWLVMNSAKYMNKNGEEMSWDFVSRKGSRKVVTVICHSKRHRRYLLISQPRVPINKTVIEFPAGLVDDGESIEAAALRELKEETGYDGEIIHVYPEVVKSAGLSDETTYIVEVKIDENAVRSTEMEATEDIQSFWLSKTKILSMLKELDHEKYIVDALVYFYFLGSRR